MRTERFAVILVELLVISLAFIDDAKCLERSSSSLLQVFVITRHGDRTPLDSFSNLSEWPLKGSLTGEGMSQMYRVGSYLRQRYVVEQQFLPPSYSDVPEDFFYARSTDKDRTLTSAHSLLMGLYPPGTGPLRAMREAPNEPALPHSIQSVPIHSENVKHDKLLRAYKNCPTLKEIRKQIKENNEWKDKERETQEFRKKLSQILGLEEILSLGKASSVFNSLQAELVHNKSNIFDIISLSDFQQIDQLKDWTLHRKFWYRSMGRIGGGNLLLHIIQAMHSTAFNDSFSGPFFTYFSAHDGTLLSLFSAMGIFDFEIPYYGSFVIFELREDPPPPDGSGDGNGGGGSRRFNVVFEYHNNGVLKNSLIPNCSPQCELETFSQLMKNGTITELEFDQICEHGMNTTTTQDHHQTSTATTVPETVLGSSSSFLVPLFVLFSFILGFLSGLCCGKSTKTQLKKD